MLRPLIIGAVLGAAAGWLLGSAKGGILENLRVRS